MKWKSLSQYSGSINRTKVELKYRSKRERRGTGSSINRTKVELKYEKDEEGNHVYELSIVPKWNWNISNPISFNVIVFYQSYQSGIEMRKGRRRIEVKKSYQSYQSGIEIKLEGIIAERAEKLSIVPKWNWNENEVNNRPGFSRPINRTKVELKS